MANTSVIRQAGQTYAFSVTASSHASTMIDDTTNDQVNYCSFLNNSANPVAIKMSQSSPCPAAVFPVDGTPGDFVLPPIMEAPIVLACPTTPFYMTAISNVAGPSIIYVTPTADQS